MTEYECAEIIKRYWLARGYEVNARVVVVKNFHQDTGPYVRSDMVSGLPPGYEDLTSIQIGLRAG